LAPFRAVDRQVVSGARVLSNSRYRYTLDRTGSICRSRRWHSSGVGRRPEVATTSANSADPRKTSVTPTRPVGVMARGRREHRGPLPGPGLIAHAQRATRPLCAGPGRPEDARSSLCAAAGPGPFSSARRFRVGSSRARGGGARSSVSGDPPQWRVGVGRSLGGYGPLGPGPRSCPPSIGDGTAPWCSSTVRSPHLGSDGNHRNRRHRSSRRCGPLSAPGRPLRRRARLGDEGTGGGRTAV
jgi:hypothetical protein